MNLDHRVAVCQVCTRIVPSKTGEPGTAQNLGFAGFLIFLFQVFQVKVYIIGRYIFKCREARIYAYFLYRANGCSFFPGTLGTPGTTTIKYRKEELSWQIKS